MIEKLLDCFSMAAWEVMRFMLDANPLEGAKPAESPPENGVVVSIGIVGDVPGEAVFHFPRSTALKIVEIMGGIEVEEIDDFVTSAVGELSNIISGNAATAMTEKAVELDIQPPQISVGSTPSVNTSQTLTTTLNTTAGSVDLVVNLY